jgi:hypothetical protein
MAAGNSEDVMCKDSEVVETGECLYMPEKNAECVLPACAFGEEPEADNVRDFDNPAGDASGVISVV